MRDRTHIAMVTEMTLRQCAIEKVRNKMLKHKKYLGELL